MNEIGMSGDDLIASADPGEGWGFFHHKHDPGLADKAAKLADERANRLALIASVMWQHDPNFRDIIDFIFTQTLRRPTCVAQLGLPMDQAYGYGAFREGQNSVAEMLRQMIARGLNTTGANDGNTIMAESVNP